MSASLSTPLRNYLLSTGALSAALNHVFLYFYNGPVPDSCDDAIDGSSTLLLKIAANTGGTVGGTFDAASNGALPKAAAETWDGLILASGTPTFMRACISTDTGSGAVTTEKRWQDTAGGVGTAIEFSNPALVANGSNRKGLDLFELRIPA